MASVGLGLAAVGRPAYINLGREEDLGTDRGTEAMRARTYELLDHAWERGVRYFDVARSYGRAEEFLAGWLAERSVGRDELEIGSKWGYAYTGGWRLDAEKHEVKDHSLATLERQLGETRELLGDRLDLYQVHSATLDSGVLEDAAVLEELTRLAGEGVRVGLSLSGPGQADTLRRALDLGDGPFSSVQATWNPLETSVGEALAEAAARSWRVTVKEAVANGRLTPHAADPASERFAALARERGASADSLAIAAALAQPWADIVLSGAATPAQLDSNLAARELALETADLEELVGLAEPPEEYWEQRSSLAWS